MTTHIDPVEAREYFRVHTDAHVEQIIAQLSLSPDGSLMHNVEAYGMGMRVPIQVATNTIYYVYALPWARGWSIFTSPLNNGVASYSWRTVPLKYKTYQMPVYCPRDQIGPWMCPPAQVAAAFTHVVQRVYSAERASSRTIKKGSLMSTQRFTVYSITVKFTLPTSTSDEDAQEVSDELASWTHHPDFIAQIDLGLMTRMANSERPPKSPVDPFDIDILRVEVE